MTRVGRLLPFGLVALLGTLGFLQYRWAGALSRAEHERMEAGLQSSLRRFSGELEEELGRVMRFFVSENEDDLAAARVAWQADEETSSIVQTVYLERSGETLEVLPDGTFVKTTAFPVKPEPRAMPLNHSPLALVIPMIGPRERWQRRRPPSIVIVALNRDYLRHHLIPLAVSTHLADYDVVVRDEEEVLWLTEGTDAAATTAHPDAVGAFLRLRPFGRGFGAGPRPGPGRARQLPGPGAEPPAQGHWRVFVRHRAGSLQAAVDEARLRNLGLGFGVLFVLGASIVLLTVSSRRATELSERKMEFVAGVSHELRTPIAVIRSAAQNLADQSVSDPSKVARYGKLIEGGALRLETLVEEVLELAGIQSDKRRYTRERLAAKELVEAVVADAGGAEVVTTLPEEELIVSGDRDALERALSNLLRNAVKHAADGPIELALERREGRVVFSVSDRGPGIPDEERAHVFEAFYRGRRAKDRQIPGSGLGLSLVNHIVREHDGEVSVVARPGGGSRFEIVLAEAGAGESH